MRSFFCHPHNSFCPAILGWFLNFSELFSLKAKKVYPIGSMNVLNKFHQSIRLRVMYLVLIFWITAGRRNRRAHEVSKMERVHWLISVEHLAITCWDLVWTKELEGKPMERQFASEKRLAECNWNLNQALNNVWAIFAQFHGADRLITHTTYLCDDRKCNVLFSVACYY